MSDYAGLIAIPVATALALVTARLLAPRLGVAAPTGRHSAIDGLRGFAALFVFFCHAAAWLYFAKTGRWANQPLRFYANIGLVGVIVFFMITAFLFVSKLMAARHEGMDWLRLYVSRILRLTPLYVFAVLLVFAIAWSASGFTLKDSPAELAQQALQWTVFTIWGTPDVNGMHDTWMAIAGVTWSLRYEWCFYLLLPLMGLALRVSAPWALILPATALAAQISWSELHAQLAASFLGGMAAAWLVQQPIVRGWARHRAAGALALAALLFTMAHFANPFKPMPLLLVSGAFTLIASGNGLYGALTSPAARILGEISYSMYLLHGIVLFGLANSGLGVPAMAGMSPWLFWSLIVAVTPALVALCMMTFVTIERPAMQRVQRVTLALRRTRPAAALLP